MARTALPRIQITRAGVDTDTTPDALDATNGNSIVNDGRTWFEVTNADTSAHILTIHLTGGADGQPITPKTISVPASTSNPKRFGPWPMDAYGTSIAIDTDSAQLKANVYTLGL